MLSGDAGREVGVDEQSDAGRGEAQLTLVNDRSGVLQRSQHVFALETRVVDEQLLHRSAARELTEHHADGDAQISDAGHTAHSLRVGRDPLERRATIIGEHRLLPVTATRATDQGQRQRLMRRWLWA